MRSQIIAVAQYASSSGKISGPKNPAFLAPTVAFQVPASSGDKCSGGGGRPSWGKGTILEWSDIAIAPKVLACEGCHPHKSHGFDPMVRCGSRPPARLSKLDLGVSLNARAHASAVEAVELSRCDSRS